MAILSSLITVLLAVSLARAHYAFVRLAHNGVWKEPLQYIRNRTGPYFDIAHLKGPDYIDDGWRAWQYPVYPGDRPESLRCGRDNLAWANQTSMLKVKPGDTIEFAALYYEPFQWNNPEYVKWDGCPDGRGVCGPDGSFAFHDGAAFMYLSRIPDGQDIQQYDGSGGWVKIYTLGLELRKGSQYPIYWLPTREPIKAALPKQTPAGKYLLRVDHVYPGVQDSVAQIYPACAHIEVESDVTGELPKGIQIEEVLSDTSPGMNYYPNSWPDGPEGYTYPGGPQWDGEKMVEIKAPKWSDS